ncbi:MAG TPA: hypothetical protein VLA49_16400 [Anaerolineales bacterium]|nr:hypothetical protein [Anaerolineales bacterium]
MKATIKLLLVFALVLASFSQHSSALAGSNYKFSGDTAEAWFSSLDGCVYTDVFVWTSDGFNQSPPGPGSASSWADLWISQWDWCTETQLLAAGGGTSLAGPDFQVSGKLDSATLNATVNVYDWVSDSVFDVSVNLTWTGVGGLSSGSSNSHYNSPGCKIHSRSRGTWRSAEVSGSVWDGATNFTPDPFGGNIYSVKEGGLSIGCN